MVIVLVCILIITLVIIIYLKLRLSKKTTELNKLIEELNIEIEKLKQQQIPEKDIKFLEFAVDMYIKYAKDLDIHSEEQHEFIVAELERIRTQHLNIGDKR